MAQIDGCDAIMLGAPTYMGMVSGPFKCFAGATAPSNMTKDGRELDRWGYYPGLGAIGSASGASMPTTRGRSGSGERGLPSSPRSSTGRVVFLRRSSAGPGVCCCPGSLLYFRTQGAEEFAESDSCAVHQRSSVVAAVPLLPITFEKPSAKLNASR